MITRRQWVIAIGASALVAPLTCIAQAQDKIWRVGMLETISTAKALGLTIPQQLLLRADEVIQ